MHYAVLVPEKQMRAMVLPAPGAPLQVQERTDPKIVPQAKIRTQTTVFPLAEANDVLTRLRTGQILGAAVLKP
jgi:D-arabinose 1-dehydrogenase-like Zn-dependent alcohol dehydrogenase